MPRPQKKMRWAKSGTTIAQRLEFYSIPVTECGCLIWVGQANERGYGKLWVDGIMKDTHRLAWIEANGPIPDNLFVLHRCDIPACINTDHLFLGTQKDNMRDANVKGRIKRKLTEDDVRKIRLATGTHREIAKQFGITQPNISAIKAGKAWVHVK